MWIFVFSSCNQLQEETLRWANEKLEIGFFLLVSVAFSYGA